MKTIKPIWVNIFGMALIILNIFGLFLDIKIQAILLYLSLMIGFPIMVFLLIARMKN